MGVYGIVVLKCGIILKCGIGEGAGLRYHSTLLYVVFHPFG